MKSPSKKVVSKSKPKKRVAANPARAIPNAASVAVTVPIEKKHVYSMRVKMNDQVFEVECDDLAQAIIDLTPKVLKTKINFLIEKDGAQCERQVFVQKGKMIFRNPLHRFAFIKQLIFKPIQN